MIRKILIFIIVAFLILSPSVSYGADILCECDYSNTCVSPGSQTKNIGDNWTQYADWSCYIEGALCSAATTITLKINVSGSWVNVSSSTPIKLISGINPSGKVGGKVTCDPTTTPRATWGLQVNTGASGTYNLLAQSLYGTAYFNITVNPPASYSGWTMVISQ